MSVSVVKMAVYGFYMPSAGGGQYPCIIDEVRSDVLERQPRTDYTVAIHDKAV